MRKYRKITLILALAAVCLAAGCGKKHEKIDLETTKTSASEETMAAEESSTGTGEESSGQETAVASSASGPYSVALQTYGTGGISVEYPSVSSAENGSLSTQQAEQVNDLLKEDILGIIEAYGLNGEEDSLSLTCNVIASDRSRLTAVWNGTLQKKDMSEPVSVFFSSTVDLSKAEHITLDRLADPYTMAGYVVSDDCRFTSLNGTLSEADQAKLREAAKSMTLNQYYELFLKADFPAEPDGNSFPGTFSYEEDGSIIFSIPVSHELGDYALAAYTPETK